MRARQPDSRAAKPDPARLARRRRVLVALSLLWFSGVAIRLYYLQVIKYGELLGQAQRQQQRTLEVAPQRGIIYDRQMNPLAMSLAVDSIFADPAEISKPAMVASLVAPVLGVDAGELRERLQSGRSFCWVKRRVTPREAARVRDLNLKGIYFQSEPKRFYPKGELASQVVGFMGLDDNGLGGIEFSRNGAIEGKPGRVMLNTDARRHTFHSSEWAGTPGKNVVLTIDEKIQFVAERALAEEIATSHAQGGVAVVQDSGTGEILAMASEPSFDPNNIDAGSPAGRLNRGVGWIYEPGSTFKAVTVSAALNEKLTNPGEVIYCENGGIVLAGHTIHDHKPYGYLSVTDVVVNSSDVGAIKLGLRLGSERFYRYILAYGLGARTDVDLPGEERGLLKPPDRWSGISIGEISIGQEIGVTPLQMVTVYSAIANGGILFQPRIVRDVFLGSQHETAPPARGRRVISAQTAETMRRILTAVVERGSGVPAQLGGYTSAGKTGTAQKIDASGRYTKYVGSFIGFAPATRPAVTILVAIDSPVGAHFGTDVAAPVFRSIAEQTLSYLNVPQDNPTQWPRTITPKPLRSPGQIPDGLLGSLPPGRESSGTATSPEFLDPPPDSSGLRLTGRPAPFDANIAAAPVELGDGPLVTVPDFGGTSVRAAATQCLRLGLILKTEGSGLAVEQNPVAGMKVPTGTRIYVRMAR